jgi:hypothetical protein
MFHPGLCIAGPVHIGKKWKIFNTETIDDDVNMNVTTVVMAIRMSAD